MTCFIDFVCMQQGLERVDKKKVAEGASVIHARFYLCSKWDDLAVYARFQYGAACYDVQLNEDVALIPWEVLKPTGFEVSIWGEDGEGGKLTSEVVFVDVARTVSLDGFEPIPSSPTLIQAFTAKAESAEIAAVEAAESAATAAENAAAAEDAANAAAASVANVEEWEITLEDGSTIKKVVCVR